MVAVTLTASSSSFAFYDKPFEVRLLHTLDRQSPYAPTLARQASYAYPGAGSLNPAASSLRDPTAQAGFRLVANYVDVSSSSSDEHIVAAPISAVWYSPTWGSASLTYAHTKTKNGAGTGGLRQALSSDEYIASVGRRINDALAVGATLRITDAEIDHQFTSPQLGGQTLEANSRFVAPDVNLGIAGRISEATTFGIVATTAKLRPTTDIRNVQVVFLPTPIPPGVVAVPPGTVLETTKQNMWQYAIGAGLGHRIGNLGFYADIRGFRVKGGVAGTSDLGRFALGFEHSVSDRLSWRGGTSLNTESDVTISLGFSYRIMNNLELEVAWQNNASPEVNPEIGRTRLLAASIGIRF